MKVKICGLKTYDEALQAVEAGADLLGFNFYPKSPRYLPPGECMRLVVRLQAAMPEREQSLKLVGVFVNASAVDVRAILGDCGLDLAQLSGDESPEYTASLGDKAFKALRPASAAQLEEAMRVYPRRCGAPAWLIDAYRPGEYGGTGQTADWSVARQAAQKVPLLLAGGLLPVSVADAIRQVRPWGVDVASGVEQSPGVKDPHKVTAFIRAVRQIEEEMLSC